MLRHDIAPRQPVASLVRSREDDVLPFGIKMPIVPGRLLIDDRTGGGVHGDILDHAVAQDLDPAPVAQGFAVFGTRPDRPSRDCATTQNAGGVCRRKTRKADGQTVPEPVAHRPSNLVARVSNLHPIYRTTIRKRIAPGIKIRVGAYK